MSEIYCLSVCLSVSVYVCYYIATGICGSCAMNIKGGNTLACIRYDTNTY